MKLSYYPGCSLKGTGRAYEESLLAVFGVLGIELQELDDWNCCGATAYMSVDETMAFVLTARNLAIAHKSGLDQVMAPCSACYLALNKTKHAIADSPALAKRVADTLEKTGMDYHNGVAVRHPLDVLVNDVGLEAIRQRVRQPLTGITVAPYYGCQIVRPYAPFDDQVRPMALDRLMEALGATVPRFPLKTKCCGGSLIGTMAEIGQRLSYLVLREAAQRGADVVATVCPLCQFNLEGYQDDMARRWEPVRLPVLHFTQLVGLAFGLEPRALGLQRQIVSAEPLLAKTAAKRAEVHA